MNDETDRSRGLGRPWQPGQSGNPAGRPKGSRNKLGEAFLADILADWRENGPATIAKCRETKPEVYLRVVASLLPRELNVRTSPLEDMTDEQLNERLHALAEALGFHFTGPDDDADGRGGSMH